MTQAKHTPGPWNVVIDDCGRNAGRPGVFASDEIDCAIVHWDGFSQDFWESARGEKEMHANARLISAAPELLEALQFALEAVPNDAMDAWAEKARAAISRALGKNKE